MNKEKVLKHLESAKRRTSIRHKNWKIGQAIKELQIIKTKIKKDKKDRVPTKIYFDKNF